MTTQNSENFNEERKEDQTTEKPQNDLAFFNIPFLNKQIVLDKKKRQFLLKMIPVFSILGALVIGSFLILFAGNNPLQTYFELFNGAFGTPRRLGETIMKAAATASDCNVNLMFIQTAFCITNSYITMPSALLHCRRGTDSDRHH